MSVRTIKILLTIGAFFLGSFLATLSKENGGSRAIFIVITTSVIMGIWKYKPDTKKDDDENSNLMK